ncbi:disulfide bond formation protein B [Deinococcus soli (ex Cha et al. 2016)]|uniref:Disulfide bond formation protein DsbB n=2 Tax=Deinococcus soli (ex Cha et al. 2016) TaxID=1309411 RepID=A0AAE3XDD6_9DEIO|nr:disulfide bond formation protein B [Deinococcus soli (ex Cha et al. 2016)]MDR6218432.1 disulfide bond formation protein DsbB [Deinococcus soli (ex Cha et al. 2016)]MDR6329172.1 disulfide bond formation protein DsbB [Deinococcus soli (ex Cha et al. 2016)]MDR6751445.1 disulfide bond formation protein DsbB [Deinococcus soli (ex Cha et al. 2016)]
MTRLHAAWAVALVATLGSLYFSEVAGFVPCYLCWMQRVCMYPLAAQLGLAVLTGDVSHRRYALTLAVPGWLIAAFHILEENHIVGGLAQCTVGAGGAGCDVKWINLLGFITIPTLSFVAFSLIIILLSWRDRPSSARTLTT